MITNKANKVLGFLKQKLKIRNKKTITLDMTTQQHRKTDQLEMVYTIHHCHVSIDQYNW